jgi:hypothetical protein
MYARVRIPIGTLRNALLVPEAALGIIQGQRYLLLVNDQDVVEQQSVPQSRASGMSAVFRWKLS